MLYTHIHVHTHAHTRAHTHAEGNKCQRTAGEEEEASGQAGQRAGALGTEPQAHLCGDWEALTQKQRPKRRLTCSSTRAYKSQLLYLRSHACWEPRSGDRGNQLWSWAHVRANSRSTTRWLWHVHYAIPPSPGSSPHSGNNRLIEGAVGIA